MKNNVRVERARTKMTQADLADRVGVSRQSIIAIESGKYVPSTVLALKMAEVFACSVEELFQLDSED